MSPHRVVPPPPNPSLLLPNGASATSFSHLTHLPFINLQRSRASPSLPSLPLPHMPNELSTTYLPRPLQTSHFFPGCPTSFGPPERKNGLRPFPLGPCPFQLQLPILLIDSFLPLDLHSTTYLYPSLILQGLLFFLALIYPLP